MRAAAAAGGAAADAGAAQAVSAARQGAHQLGGGWGGPAPTARSTLDVLCTLIRLSPPHARSCSRPPGWGSSLRRMVPSFGGRRGAARRRWEGRRRCRSGGSNERSSDEKSDEIRSSMSSQSSNDQRRRRRRQTPPSACGRCRRSCAKWMLLQRKRLKGGSCSLRRQRSCHSEGRLRRRRRGSRSWRSASACVSWLHASVTFTRGCKSRALNSNRQGKGKAGRRALWAWLLVSQRPRSSLSRHPSVRSACRPGCRREWAPPCGPVDRWAGEGRRPMVGCWGVAARGSSATISHHQLQLPLTSSISSGWPATCCASVWPAHDADGEQRQRAKLQIVGAVGRSGCRHAGRRSRTRAGVARCHGLVSALAGALGRLARLLQSILGSGWVEARMSKL